MACDFLIIDDQYHDDIMDIPDHSILGYRSFEYILNRTDLLSRLDSNLSKCHSSLRVWPGARTIEQALDILNLGCPTVISFDHDLGIVDGHDQTSMTIVNWMIDRDLDLNYQYIPENFVFAVHSENPAGRQNIIGTLTSYLNFRSKN